MVVSSSSVNVEKFIDGNVEIDTRFKDTHREKAP